jgi:predicted DNA-binding protein YlxM (UPF0122 family)
MHDHYSIGELCEAFDVSRSGYHAWISRAPCARVQADVQLMPLTRRRTPKAAANTAARA